MLALLLSPGFIVAINNPLMWESLRAHQAPPAAIGVSGYVGIDRHQALRLNYATYEVDTAAALVTGLEGGGDGSCAYVGRATATTSAPVGCTSRASAGAGLRSSSAPSARA